MTQTIPDGQQGLIPHLVCDPCNEAIEFYKKAFAAEEVFRMPMPGSDKILHAQILIDGRSVMLTDDFPEICNGQSRSPQALGGTPVTIHRYVTDCDAAVRQAEAAGAAVVMPPADMFWGDRYAVVNDPFGHAWSLATHVNDLSNEEIEKAAREFFAQQ